jgi:hypothetical protein
VRSDSTQSRTNVRIAASSVSSGSSRITTRGSPMSAVASIARRPLAHRELAHRANRRLE